MDVRDDLEQEFLGDVRIKPDQHKLQDLFRQWVEPILTVGVAAIFVALFFMFGAIADLQHQQDDIIQNQAEGRERTFQTRAVQCESVIIDNDRDFALTSNCTTDEVLAYYPPTICEYFDNPANCGTKFVPSPYPDPPRPG